METIHSLAEIPKGGAIKESIGWEADVPFGTHAFTLISIYGIGTTEAEIVANAVAFDSVQIETASMSATDEIITAIGDIPLGIYSCATFIAESFDGSNISGVYDSKVDADVLTIVSGLGATIISTSFSAV